MMHASFSPGGEAAISGAYQYDTGQRLRMHGLPTPQELAGLDDFLSGDGVAVQAQFGFVGDSQSEPRLAVYEEATGCWICDVPDAYLTQGETVNVYVYVSYGADDTHSRSKTMYAGSFRPVSRPAPSDTVTPDQVNAWDALVAEVNLTLSSMNTAISNANAAASAANEAAQAAADAAEAAQDAADAASAAGSAWGGATAHAQTLEPGSSATVTLGENANGTKRLTFGIPRGEKGDKGDTGPAGVTFTLRDGALYIVTD